MYYIINKLLDMLLLLYTAVLGHCLRTIVSWFSYNAFTMMSNRVQQIIFLGILCIMDIFYSIKCVWLFLYVEWMGSKEQREAITEFITALFSWQEINFSLPFCISSISTKKQNKNPQKNLKASKLRT